MKRIVIIGPCGSGKTTLGNHLAENLDYPVTDLDDLYWLPNWQCRPSAEFASLIEDATEPSTWIICGNQSRYRHLIWPKADTIIWLDPPLTALLWRSIRRALSNIRTKADICNGNQDSFSRLFGRDSIVFWVIKTYFKHRRNYSKEIETTTHAKWIHSKKISFLSPHEL